MSKVSAGGFAWDCPECHTRVTSEVIAPGRILIDPTAPETVAALAEAMHAQHTQPPGHDVECAQGILPAFVARLRGVR
jgi:hypothetical protein